MAAPMTVRAAAAGLIVCAGLLVLRPAAGQPPPPGRESITAADLEREVALLASDAMRGRLTATRGNRLAAQHIEDRFERSGLRGPAPGRSFRRPVELIVPALGDGNAWRTLDGGDVEAAEMTRDFFPAPFSGSGRAAGPVVFAGFGISAPDLDHDDYRGADVAGKIVLVLDHEPGEFDPESRFAGVVASERGRTVRKALEAQRRGAAAIAIVDDVHNHASRWSIPDLAARAWPAEPPRVPRYQLAAWVRPLRIPAVRISVEMAERLVGRTGGTLEELAQRAEEAGGAAPVEIPGVTVEVAASVRRDAASVDNVVGLIEGADPGRRGEWLIICAHFDHEGASGSRIFNGADDNASGVAGLLEIAEAYAAARRGGSRPARSVLLAAWNAEERGLLGSWAYAEQPLAPLRDTVAVINLDMIGRSEEVPEGGGSRYIGLAPQTAESNRNAVNVIGASFSAGLREAAEAANRLTNLDLRFRYDNNRSNLLRRSDQWPFLFHRVPAIFVHTGLHPDYHTARDRPETLDYEKMARVVRLVYDLSWDLAQRTDRPAFDRPAP